MIPKALFLVTNVRLAHMSYQRNILKFLMVWLCRKNLFQMMQKMSVVQIAEYVTRNDGNADESELLGNTTFYFTKYGQFIQFLDHGRLKVPTDVACQWTFFCFVIFQAVKNNVCRKSLSYIFSLVNEFYSFRMHERHCIVLSNIFLNKLFCKATP